MRRIGHITTDYKPILGGQETYIANLFSILKDAGYEQQVYQHYLGEKGDELRFVPKIVRTNKKVWPNVWSYNILVNLYANELRKMDRLIVHFPFHYPAVMWHKGTIVLSHGVEWRVPPQSVQHKLRARLAAFAYKNAHSFVANDTDYFRQMGLEIKPGVGFFSEVAPRRWFIPNCIDINTFKPAEPYPDLSRLNPVLLPRNINTQRGILLAIESFAIFMKKHPETNLVVVGDFQDFEYKRMVFKRINDLDLTGKAYFMGSVKWDNMPRIYSSGLLTLIPSLYSEGTSLSALESMSCGTPVVSTSIGGLADLPAVKAPHPSPEAFAESMSLAFQDRVKLANVQMTKVKATFNLENWRNAWLKALGN